MTSAAGLQVPLVSPLVRRVESRIHRFAFDWAYRRDRRRYSSHLPDISPTARSVVNKLEIEGACVTSLSELNVVDVGNFLSRARSLFSQMSAGIDNPDVKKSYVVHDPPGLMAQFPDVLSLGLSGLWLDIVESYLGLPPAFRGGTARRDLADGQAVETRLWHLDDEDKRIVKFIVYIDEVDENGGGFEFVPKTKLPEGFRRYRRVDDEEMKLNVPERDWVKCSGPAGTVVIGDTCSIWHRGSVPVSRERHAIFYGYNSTRPRHPQYCDSLVPSDLKEAMLPTLDTRQRAVLLASPESRQFDS